MLCIDLCRPTSHFVQGAWAIFPEKYFDTARKKITANVTWPNSMLSTNWNGLSRKVDNNCITIAGLTQPNINSWKPGFRALHLSLNGINSVCFFSFNTYKKHLFHFWLLAFARKVSRLPEKKLRLCPPRGAATPSLPGSYAYGAEIRPKSITPVSPK